MLHLLSPDNAYSGANLLTLLVLVLLSAVFFVCFSGFVKFNIVLNIIKNAVGTQQIPPAIVVNILAALMALNSVWPDVKPGLERIKPYFSEQSEYEQGLDIFDELSLEPESTKKNITMYYLASHLFEFFPELLERAKVKTERLLAMIDIPLNFDQETDTFKYF